MTDLRHADEAGRLMSALDLHDRLTLSLAEPVDLIELYGTLAEAAIDIRSTAEAILSARKFRHAITANMLATVEAAGIRAAKAAAEARAALSRAEGG